ncbi:MAG: RrF2 family transcriptional regulator [Armatimonadota bacterium]
MITRETDYAIRAMLYLAGQQGNGVVSTTVLAKEMDIPYRFLRRILLRLVEEGLVHTTRGKQGGLQMVASPAEVSLYDIIRAIDPATVALNSCIVDNANCNRSAHCVVHEELLMLQADLNRRLADISLAALIERDRHQRVHR